MVALMLGVPVCLFGAWQVGAAVLDAGQLRALLPEGVGVEAVRGMRPFFVVNGALLVALGAGFVAVASGGVEFGAAGWWACAGMMLDVGAASACWQGGGAVGVEGEVGPEY